MLMEETILFKDVVSNIMQFCIVAIAVTLAFLCVFVKKKKNSRKDIPWQHKLISNYFIFLFLWIFVFLAYLLTLSQMASWVNYVALSILTLAGICLAYSARKNH